VDVNGKFDENAVFKRQTTHVAVGRMHEMASIELDGSLMNGFFGYATTVVSEDQKIIELALDP
jgi:hypothetical protein